MSRIIKDEELKDYQERIGAERYRDLYLYETNKVRRLTKSNERYSGKHYANSVEKLNAIRQKYKNGVTQEIIEEWLGK